MIAGDLLGERARLTPDNLALVMAGGGKRLTYAQLDERAVRCAAFLQKLGLKKGDRIGILAYNRQEFLEAFFAVGKCGAILVPLNTRATAHELGHIVRDSGMQAILYDGELSATVVKLREMVSIEHWIALDVAIQPRDLNYPAETASLDPSNFVRVPCDLEDIYSLLYTSGTTGKPKGVMTPHRMVLWNAYNTVISWQLRDTDVSPVFMPLCHAGGLGAFLTPIFAIGGTIVLHKAFDATEVWKTLADEKCTVVLGVPTIYKLLMEVPEFQSTQLPHLRWFISGGAPMPQYILQAYAERGMVLKQGYGLTEAGVNCFAMTVEESVRKIGSIGQRMFFCEARLADKDGVEVPADEVGELWLRGLHVSKGYWNQPDATAATIDNDGWLHTGDLARCDEDGFYYIAGRSKDMFISGGVNVYPAEVEAELVLHPDVHDAAVVGVPHETWGEIGIAFVVSATNISAESLASYLGERLSKYKVPKHFVFVSELPRTAYGKVVKPELREHWLNSQAGRP